MMIATHKPATSCQPLQSATPEFGPGFMEAMRNVLRRLLARRMFRSLEALSDHQLCDIGLTREDIATARQLSWVDDVHAYLGNARRHNRNRAS